MTQPMRAAATGARWLDRTLKAWWRAIRPEELEMAEGCNCILGQLFGSYTKGLDILQAGTGKQINAERYGFISTRGYSRLNDAWIKEIETRKEQAR